MEPLNLTAAGSCIECNATRRKYLFEAVQDAIIFTQNCMLIPETKMATMTNTIAVKY